MDKDHKFWMQEALKEAQKAYELDEVPIGAVVVLDGEVIGRGYNQSISQNDPSAHAEVQALREAAKNLGNYRLNDCKVYVTLEPCLMCAGALVHARVGHLIFGAFEPKAGAIKSHLQVQGLGFLNHQFEVTSGIEEEQCSVLLSGFFSEKRKKQKLK